MSKHTPEPWVIDEREDLSTNFYSDDAIGSIIGGCLAYNYAYRTPDERKANARRIVACVNALAGVPTEWVEKYSISGSENVAQENARITKQRDELLGSLETLYRDYVRLMEAGRDRIMDLGGFCDPVDVMERADHSLVSARAAIAKAKGIDHE